jgi:hypothetical protein
MVRIWILRKLPSATTLWQEVKTKEPLGPSYNMAVVSTGGHGLKAFQASFSAPNTPLAIILCSNVVFLTLSYEKDREG